MSTRRAWATECIQGQLNETLFQKVKERLGIADSGRALAWPKAWALFPAQEEAGGRKSLKWPHRRGLEKGQGQVSTSARLKNATPSIPSPLPLPDLIGPHWPFGHLPTSNLVSRKVRSRARQEGGRGQPALPLSHAGLNRLSWSRERNEMLKFRVLTNILAQNTEIPNWDLFSI